MRLRPAILLAGVMMIGAIALSGCVRTREIKLVRYGAGNEPALRTITQSGVYRIKWKIDDKFKSAAVKPRYLTAGTPVGFETAEDGTVIAIAGEQRIRVGREPPRAQYCCWYQRWKEESRFGIEVREFVVAAVVGSAVVGGTIAALTVDAYLNQDRDRKDRYRQ
jgi:hypothetical protein